MLVSSKTKGYLNAIQNYSTFYFSILAFEYLNLDSYFFLY